MQSTESPRGRRARQPRDDRGRSGRRSAPSRSWSCAVRKLAVDERSPRPVVSGKFFADEDDRGRRSWEAVVTLQQRLEDLDVDQECTVLLELEDGGRVRGRAVVEPERAGIPPGQARYLFVGSGPLTLFDWSVLEDT